MKAEQESRLSEAYEARGWSLKELSTAKTMFMAIAALAGWFALALQLYLSINLSYDKGQSSAEAVIRYFSYFTILTNIIVALSLAAPLMAPASRLGRFFSSPKTVSGIAMYISTVLLVYFFVLRNAWNPQGAQLFANVMFHYIIPLAYVVYWLVFVRKGALAWKDAMAWLVYPAVYTALVLFRGAVSGLYPYPFIDAGELGYPRVLMNMTALLVVFLAMGLIMVAIDRAMGSRIRVVRS